MSIGKTKKQEWEKRIIEDYATAIALGIPPKELAEDLAEEIQSQIKKGKREVLEKVVKALQQKFDIDCVDIEGKKFVNAKQAQKQVVKVFRRFKQEL